MEKKLKLIWKGFSVIKGLDYAPKRKKPATELEKIFQVFCYFNGSVAVGFYILLRVVNRFAANYNTFPGQFDGAMDEEISRLKTKAVSLLSDLSCNGSTLTEDTRCVVMVLLSSIQLLLMSVELHLRKPLRKCQQYSRMEVPMYLLKTTLEKIRGHALNRRLSISKEALGAFGKSQTYRRATFESSRFEACSLLGIRRLTLERYEIMMPHCCCVENPVEDRYLWIIGTSFHATYCKEKLERFKLRSGKVRLAHDKILKIANVRDVVLKTSFVQVGLEMLVTFRAYKEKVISVGIGMSMLASKGKVPDVRKVDIYFCKPGGLGKQKNLSFIISRYYDTVIEDCSRSCGRYNANLQVKYLKFDNGGEYSSCRTFRAESTGLRVEASKMLWADSVSTAYVIYRIPYVSMWVRIREDEWRGKDTSLTHLKVFGCDSFVKVKDVCEEAMKCTFIGNGSDKIQYSFRNRNSHHVIRSRDIIFMDSIHGAMSVTDSSSLTKLIQKSQVVLVDIPDDLAENDIIVAEHGLSSEITQSPGGSSDTSKGSKESGSFEDSENQMNNTLKIEHPPRKEAPTLHRYKDPPESPGLRDGSTIHIPESDYLQEKKHHKACRCSGLKKNRIVAKGTRLDWWLRFPTETREPSYMGALNDTSTHHKSEGFQLVGQEENLKCILKEIMYGLIQAPRLRYLKFDSFMQNDKVDDILVVGSDMAEFNKPKW
ncbi:retrovirus-related pol polyprotein from transposon TNT 1-94 [Tanacetum coccineum]